MPAAAYKAAPLTCTHTSQWALDACHSLRSLIAGASRAAAAFPQNVGSDRQEAVPLLLAPPCRFSARQMPTLMVAAMALMVVVVNI
jgi:hypothetical protein